MVETAIGGLRGAFAYHRADKAKMSSSYSPQLDSAAQ
jgi:hypothetical protein